MSAAHKVLFQTGGSAGVGFGHVRRCLSLAEELRRLGADSIFLLDGDAALVDLVIAQGFAAKSVDQGLDWSTTAADMRNLAAEVLVVDSYAPSSSYFVGLAEAGLVTVAIDNLADRYLPVDVLVNGSAGAHQLDYRCREDTVLLLGPAYILLRTEFRGMLQRRISPSIRRVLITVGGSDAEGLTPRLMGWIADILPDASLDVVIGPLFNSQETIERLAASLTCETCLHFQPASMCQLMLDADLAVCGGGQTLYELAATGTPAVAVRVADNQTGNLRSLEEAGVLAWAGDSHDSQLRAALIRGIGGMADTTSRESQSERGRQVVDGQGAERVASAIIQRMENVN